MANMLNSFINYISRKKSKDKQGRKSKIPNARSAPITVTLKCIKNSQEMSDEYLKRVNNYK
jgi:hypothetical protein